MANWISSKLKVAETFLQQIDQQAADSLGKNDKPRSEELSSENPRKSIDVVPLKDQLKKKKENNEANSLIASGRRIHKSNSTNGSVNNSNRESKAIGVGASVSNVKPYVNLPKAGLTDTDWTELLSAPSQPTSPAVSRTKGIGNGGVRKDGRRKGSSGSNVLALEAKRKQKNGSGGERDLPKQDAVLEVKANDESIGRRGSEGEGSVVMETRQRMSSAELGSGIVPSESREMNETDTRTGPVVENRNETNERNNVSDSVGDKHDFPSSDPQVGSVQQAINKDQPAEMASITVNGASDFRTGVGNARSNFMSSIAESDRSSARKMTFPSVKGQSPSVSDVGSSSETDSTSTSDSDGEREREERKRRRAQILAERAAAKAVEAIKERENLVARLEGEKQSLEKILEERAKQQVQEASELQNNMMETMDAVELEKQKHNNTRMEALARLSKLETTNADLSRTLAAAQWNLEVEINQVAELRQLIELKEASHEELRRKISATCDTGNQMVVPKGVEFEHEIIESEYTFVKEKIGRLQEKAKTLVMNIEMTQKETEVPTEVEVELKRRLGQLTDHLIQKQAQVESLSSEKATLLFRIEAVSRLLDENKSMLNGADMASTSNRDDLESGIWKFPNSKLRPILEERIQSGRKHLGSLVHQLDSIFCAGAMFLRRNYRARMWSLVYLVCLHLWVMYILISHSPISDESRSGAIFSLENLNNTGGA